MPRLPLHLLRLVRPLPAQCPRFTPQRPVVQSALSPSFPAFLGRSLFLTRSLLPAAPDAHPFAPSMLQVRHRSRGNEYQPSQRVRKRRHGFLARKRSVGGRKILARRKAKQRRFLTH
ncbi:hypothetical protein EVG20_g70 [Dentipellis fragilis]|uniref:Large ribosomal subunit protein bL34m n=1 Tax=Dentipellis fragilis TaxID=205917 RepID=A0A4Y9ZEN2_9AGAM|nr:hypothetical protein EVG20_g70 [Dentipellis fragilis]